MACCGGGYPEYRFQTSVDKNFFCPICTDVLKDPVQCHNQHLFCRACITEHLKNSQTCPVCMEKLTEEALSKPARIVTGYLDGLMVNCEHEERGCVELVELGCLETHISVCEYKPVTCPNARCEAVVNMADLDEHTSEVCEYRQVYCEECDENMSLKKYGKHGCFISKDVQAIKVVLFQVQHQVKEMSNTQKEILEAIQNLTTASKMSTVKGEAASTSETKPQGDIVVIGGQNGVLMSSSWLDSVEMYSLANRTWTKLAPMQEKRAAATAHLYNGRVMVTGGRCDRSNVTRSMEYVRVREESEKDSWATVLCEESGWEPFFAEYGRYKRRPEHRNRGHRDEFSSLQCRLPFQCLGHKTAILNHHLWLVGGVIFNGPQRSLNASIHMSPIHSPHAYSFVVKCRMPKPLSFHGLEIVGNELLIIGGSTTGRMCDAVSTVLSYNTATNALRGLRPLPFPMLDMATVKHGDDVIIIGGSNNDDEYLNTVFKYNHKKRECEQLPGMKHKRSECAAVISGNKVFVMGGYNKEQGYLSSVECFDLESQIWHELPSMNEEKYKIAAVLVP
ncbi:TNF receptor-associated factor 6-like [Paramuricea clavata]|uniref:TNF receptor-associated factor 6-like n=1 Tax=Paramuricea clavata TaxID=317549 RepID=A0A6S7JAD3_PARCT|nr:TNF receptor-associated factor 6-like [Paramuricea clavata]